MTRNLRIGYPGSAPSTATILPDVILHNDTFNQFGKTGVFAGVPQTLVEKIRTKLLSQGIKPLFEDVGLASDDKYWWTRVSFDTAEKDKEYVFIIDENENGEIEEEPWPSFPDFFAEYKSFAVANVTCSIKINNAADVAALEWQEQTGAGSGGCAYILGSEYGSAENMVKELQSTADANGENVPSSPNTQVLQIDNKPTERPKAIIRLDANAIIENTTSERLERSRKTHSICLDSHLLKTLGLDPSTLKETSNMNQIRPSEKSSERCLLPSDLPTLWKEVAQAVIQKAPVVFSTCVNAGHAFLADSAAFDAVVIDETASGTHAETLIPAIHYLGFAKSIIHAGDGMQNKAILKSRSQRYPHPIKKVKMFGLVSGETVLLYMIYQNQGRWARFYPAEVFRSHKAIMATMVRREGKHAASGRTTEGDVNKPAGEGSMDTGPEWGNAGVTTAPI
ncbi:hypothetical protein MMC25_008020 [Agyrium rufum]|nr:hypothetical protein [Agyrium rufum]